MADRELLEKAAKALGTELLLMGSRWNPLEDDGDALRLAVTLGILQTATLHEAMHNVPDWSDRYAATRRAIVRAAAAIGEQA